MNPIETIVVTRNSHINAAAIGVWEDGVLYRMRIFESSNTYKNLTKNEICSINFVSEEQLPLLLRCALVGHNNDVQELNDDYFLFWEGVPYIKGTFSVIAKVEHKEIQIVEDWIGRAHCLLVEAREIQRFGERKNIITRENFIPVLECAVLATKYFDAEESARAEIRRKIEALLSLVVGFEEEVKRIKEIVELE